MKAWRRSEPRLVRPFFAINDLESELGNAELQIGDREQAVKEDIVHVDPVEFDGLRIVIRHNLDVDHIKSRLGERADGVALVLSLRDPMLKRRHVLDKRRIVEDLPQQHLIDAEMLLEYGHRRELDMTLALALDEEQPPQPGWPSRRGEWVAKRTFKLRPRGDNPAFDVRKMTREEAEAWTGFPGALIHVEYYEGRLLEESDEAGQVATCYIAEDVHHRMQQRAGTQLHVIVIVEIIAAILGRAAGEIEEAQDIPDGSPLSNILKKLGDGGSMKLDSLKRIVRKEDKLRAAVHDRVEIVKQLRSL